VAWRWPQDALLVTREGNMAVRKFPFMASENFPFDREHWLVTVSFPVSLIACKDNLFDRVAEMASRRGGRDAGRSYPIDEFMGRPGCDTFDISLAFEAGDVNTERFIATVRDEIGAIGASVSFDPESVFPPDDKSELLDEESVDEESEPREWLSLR
jgi:hypothetical protein